ncbi:NACHT domain-containing protein [Streptomyces alboflavus]|uniref:NACHT domain-containing protein n=1 Tax=Streptomyces alboflavus TaxID=67267 RepID=UPI00369C1857
MTEGKGSSAGRVGLVLLGVGVPFAAVTQLKSVAAQHPVLSVLLLVAFEAVLAGVAFASAVSKELEGRLSKRVAGHVERLLLGRLTHYESRYRQYLIQRYSVGNLKGLAVQGAQNPRLEDVFVDVSLKPSSLHVAQRSALADVEPELATGERRSLQGLLDQPREHVLVIIGAPGTGKTTLLQHTTVVFARRDPGRRAKRQLPVLVPLRDHVRQIAGEDAGSTSAVTMADVARLTLTAAGLGDAPAGWFENQLERGRCVVLLDGLDEVADPYARQRLVQWTEVQIARYPGNHWVLTTRPQGYDVAPLNGAEALVVRRFTPDQISRFVHGWYAATENLGKGAAMATAAAQDRTRAQGRARAGNPARKSAEALLSRLRGQPSLYGLSSNPLLLTMLCNVHRYLGALPGTRAELYGQICQVLLWRQYQAKGIRDEAEAGPAREAVLRELAYGMMSHRTQSVPAEGTLTDELLKAPVGRETPGVTPSAFLTAVARTGLLIEREPGRFSFAHQTFQEYLAAAYIQQNGTIRLLEERITDAWWHETILLWAATTDPSEVIEACLERDTAETLALALDCYDEARQKPELLGRRLEEVRLEALQAPNEERRRLMVGVTLARHLRQVLWLAQGVLISPSPLTHGVYRLFTNEHPQFALPSPAATADDDGDDGNGDRNVEGEEATAYGVPPNAPRALVDWVNQRLEGSATFRLPLWDEAVDPAMRLLVPPDCALWVEPPKDWADRRPVCWTPEGMWHPWSVPLSRVRARMEADAHLTTATRSRSGPGVDAFWSMLIRLARNLGNDYVGRDYRILEEGHQWRTVTISSDEVLIRPSSPELLEELFRQLPLEIAQSWGNIESCRRTAQQVAEALAVLGPQLVRRGVAAEPEAADVVRRAVLYIAELCEGDIDERVIGALCRDIAIGTTVLQDRAEGLIPPREVVLLVRA